MTLTLGSTQDTSTRRPLTRAACLALLAPGGHGRLATTTRSLPIIIPVRFTLFGDDVIFSSPDLGEGLSRAVADSVVAFQTDQVGSDDHALWAVHVTGVARIAHGSEEPGFRVSSEVITGWRRR